MNIPTSPLPPVRINPAVTLLYGPRKIGKSTLGALLPEAVHLDTARGTEYLPCRRVPIPDLATFIGDPFAGSDLPTRDMRDQAKAESHRNSAVWALKNLPGGRPKRLVVDMINELEDWAEEWATREYKLSIQGKNYDQSSVFFLDRGLGYFLVRQKFGILWHHLLQCADELLIFAHQRDSKMEKTEQVSAAEDLDLTGRLRKVLASHCSVMGYLSRKQGGGADVLQVTFQTRNSDMIVGSRVPRLEGKTFPLAFVDQDGFFCHGWEQIFLPEDGSPPQWRRSSIRKDPGESLKAISASADAPAVQ